MNYQVKNRPGFTGWISAAIASALLTGVTSPARAGWMQTAAGPFDYNTFANWEDLNADTIGDIDGLWNSTLALTAAQTVTFDQNTVLSTGWSFNYGGNFGLTLRGNGGNRTVTLGGDVALNTSGGTSANVAVGSTTAGQNLNLDLGGATRTFNVAASRTLTLTNAVSNGGITKSGSGTLVLSGVNSYGGGTIISGGVLGITSDANLGAAGSAVELSGGTLRVGNTGTYGSGRTMTISANSTLAGGVNFSGAAITLASTLTGSGRLTISANPSGNNTIGTVVFTGDNSDFSGGISMDRGTIELRGASAGGTGSINFTQQYQTYGLRLRSDSTTTFGVSSVNLPNNSAANAFTINVDRLTSGSGNTLTLKSLTENFSEGTRTVNITGANNYSLRINSFTFAPAYGTAATATLNPTTANLTVGEVFIQSGTLILSGSATNNSTIETITGGRTGYTNDNGGLRVTGGNWTLTGVNYYGYGFDGDNGGQVGSNHSFGSGTEITGGRLIVSQDRNLGATPTSFKSRNIVLRGGTLAAAESFTLSSNRGIGIGALTGSTGSTGIIEVASSATLTYDGVISSAGNTGTNNLTKTGNGTLLLGNANTYNGLTTVSAGTLGGSGSLAGSLAIAAGATLAPGNSPGTFTLGGDLTLDPGSILAFDLNAADQTVGSGVNDLIVLTGPSSTLTLAGTINIFSDELTAGTWRLFNYAGLLIDNGLTIGTINLAAGSQANIVAGDGGIDLVIAAIPEPATLALLAMGGLLLSHRRRA